MSIARGTRWGLGLSVLIGMMFLTTAWSQVDFSGTWTLDKSQSDLEQLRGLRGNTENIQDATLSMVIEQQGTTLHITRTIKGEGKEATENQVYKTDGTATTNTGFRGESVVTKASWEGNKLLVTSTRTIKMLVREVSVESKALWGLSPDGNTLTIDGTAHTLRGERHAKLVFRKQ